MKKGRVASIPAPVFGLVLEQSLKEPRTAEHLENWWPTKRGARVRGGQEHVATATGPVVSMFTYNHPTNGAMFAATETTIDDVTGLNPSVTATSSVTGQSAGYYSTQQIGTVGGDYLLAANGADYMQLFDGATWQVLNAASTPSITGLGSGKDTDLISQLWLYRSRIFMVEKDTLTAHYLPVDSVGGAAGQVSMAGVFQRGGSLLFGATWSLDSGDGLDDKCVFFSTEGEVAVYSGGDPSTSDGFVLEGRYDISKPLGIKATMRAGGDLVVATVDGVVPMSEVIQKDPAALSLAAVTRRIEPLWQREASAPVLPWEIIKWPERNVALFTLPDAPTERMLVAHLETGAFAQITGWGATCGTVHNGQAYIGQEDGNIYACDETGSDNGAVFAAKFCGSFSDLGHPVAFKQAHMMRSTFLTYGEFAVEVGIAVDYTVEFPTTPQAIYGNEGSDYLVWDVGDWDEKLWYASNSIDPQQSTVMEWEAVSGVGYSFAPVVVVASGGTEKIDCELIGTELVWEAGGVAV